jgi:hypothetical protein
LDGCPGRENREGCVNQPRPRHCERKWEPHSKLIPFVTVPRNAGWEGIGKDFRKSGDLPVQNELNLRGEVCLILFIYPNLDGGVYSFFGVLFTADAQKTPRIIHHQDTKKTIFGFTATANYYLPAGRQAATVLIFSYRR